MTDAIKRLMVYCPHGHELEEDDFPDVGRYVLFDDHAAAVARLESRLSIAEKVVEAARLRPWITRHSGDTEDSADVLRCEVCGFDWPDPEQITNADEYPEKHADSCETVAINEALAAYRSAK